MINALWLQNADIFGTGGMKKYPSSIPDPLLAPPP